MMKSAILGGLAMLMAASGAAAFGSPREIPGPPIGADGDGMFFVSYPKASLRLNEHGVVHYRLDVGEDGQPTSCSVTKSSGYPRLDRLTCATAVHHARFTPPRSESGAKVTAVYEGKVNWLIR